MSNREIAVGLDYEKRILERATSDDFIRRSSLQLGNLHRILARLADTTEQRARRDDRLLRVL